MVELAEHIRRVLFAPQLNPDSPQDLLRALQRAGAQVESTRSWKLKAWAQQNPARAEERHAMIDPVLRYKKLYRIWTANGWNWADTWVHQGVSARILRWVVQQPDGGVLPAGVLCSCLRRSVRQ